MKNSVPFWLFFFVLLSISCEDDNIDITSFEENPPDPTTIEVQNSVELKIANSTPNSMPASAYKLQGTLPSGANYFVASDDVFVDCSDDSFQSSFDGGELFRIFFYADDFGSQVFLADFQTIWNGENITVSNSLPTPNCTRDPIEVVYQENDGRLTGTVTGEFYTLAEDIISPFDSCVNFVSVGILEASFDAEIIPCN